jgi:primosomal protein N' (replication factor Y)
VEEELLSIFPGIETIRMDTDTVGIEGSHDRILKRFEKEKIPVLIGTQMVTKGLDFPNVTLVGVIAADLSLYMDDFRSYERTFSLITQVVGRAGRGGKSGRAVIQTFTPGNEVIRFASSQDYEAFYESEIMIRKARGLPPFSDILTVTASGLTEMNVIMCCTSFRDRLEECLRMDYKDLPMQILGPAPLSVVRVNNRFRYKVTMLTANNKRVRALIGALVKEFKSNPRFSDVALFADTE